MSIGARVCVCVCVFLCVCVCVCMEGGGVLERRGGRGCQGFVVLHLRSRANTSLSIATDSCFHFLMHPNLDHWKNCQRTVKHTKLTEPAARRETGERDEERESERERERERGCTRETEEEKGRQGGYLSEEMGFVLFA